MVKDDNDVQLDIGQLVLVTLASTLVKGRVIGIRDGGMLVGKRIQTPQGDAQQMTPGLVTVRVELELQYHPQQPVVNGLLVLIDPTPEKAKEIKEIYEKTGKKSPGLVALN
jgi:hypothetical protein